MKRMNKKTFEMNDDALDSVSGGFLGFLRGCTKEPTPAAVARGLIAGMEFDTKRSCMTCGSLGCWNYDILDTWMV